MGGRGCRLPRHPAIGYALATPDGGELDGDGRRRRVGGGRECRPTMDVGLREAAVVRAGRILGAVAAGAVWVLALGWSIGLLGAMGVAAADRFDAAVARFDERLAASELAFDAMEAEVVEAELALERSDGRVQDPQTRARLDAAHADAGREIDRLEDALAGQVVGRRVRAAAPSRVALAAPLASGGARRRRPRAAVERGLPGGVRGAADGRGGGRPLDGRVGGRARRRARGGARRADRSGLDDGPRGARRPDDGRVRRRGADRDRRAATTSSRRASASSTCATTS